MGMDIEQELALVLTCSVDPKGMPAAASRADPVTREADYAAALDYYLTEHPRVRRIVFAENSLWPLDAFRAVTDRRSAADRVEFLSFSGNDFPREYGKSYGEMLMLDHVFAESRFVRESRYVAKMTGRSFLVNLTTMLEKAPVPFDFYGDLHDHGLYEMMGLNWCGRYAETRFYVLTPAFYETHLRGTYTKLNENGGMFVENLFYKVIKENRGNGKVIPRFRNEPGFRGIAGHGNKNYGGRKERAKRGVRAAVRKLIPGLWL